MHWKCRIPAVILAVFIVAPFANGCRPEVCRKRRETRTENNVVLHLEGCTGLTKPWVVQLAYCFNISSFELASRMKERYAVVYGECTQACSGVRAGTSQNSDILMCVDCFQGALEQELSDQFGVNIFTSDCINSYVVPSLNNALPSFGVLSQTDQQADARITLPHSRPANNWWGLTVRLPCRPPLFQFFNANCINTLANDARSRDFVLSQNRLIHSGSIQFLVRFNDVCRFDVNEIEIVWDKSIPAFAFPQLSSFPSSFPPKQEESGNIFFDSTAYEQYERTVGSKIKRNNRRRKRNVQQTTTPPNLGISMPCKVRRFTVTDSEGRQLVMKSKGTRFLLEPKFIYTHQNGTTEIVTMDNFSGLNFTMDFGYKQSGCIFSSNEPKAIANPPPNWLDAKERIKCYQCQNAESEEECGRSRYTYCQEGEICQSEVRHLGSRPTRISITKSCKQASACENNWINNNRLQCRPGKLTSVCRCCCNTNFCNKDAFHCT